jgi:hypothetical protein
MKTYLQILLTIGSLALLNACATSSGGGPTSLAGTWTNSLGTAWTIKRDGTFEVARSGSSEPEIRGTYSVNGDTFTIEHNEGKIPKGCKGKGVYKFHRAGNDLTFTLVRDTCKDRKKNVLSSWHMK